MPELLIGSSAIGDNTSTFQDFSVEAQTLDSATDQKETKYFNHNFPKQLGYYKKIPELKSAIDAKARWTIGKGYKSNGDSFAHIIRDNEGNLINLKPLPQLQIVANKAGIIIRYEQLDRHNKKAVKTFKPEEIFHMMQDRVGDEIHGVSVIDAVEEIILSYNEAMTDYKIVMHRGVYPVRIWHLDTDVPAEIAAFKAKAAESKYKGEDIFIPKGVVETEISAVAPNATLDPKAWIMQLKQSFWKAVGCPEIIVGGSSEFSEASAKIAYLAFEQVIEEEQLYIEEQVLAQLNLEIELEFPATLQNELLSDEGKSETMQASTPEDTAVTNTEVTPGVPA